MRKFYSVLSIVIGLIMMFSSVVSVKADKPEMVTLCHAAGQVGTLQFVTLTISWNAAFGQAGHFNEDGTPQAGHENDYLGACISTATPTDPATATSTITNTATFTPTDSATATYTATNTATDTNTPHPPTFTLTASATVTNTPIDPTLTPTNTVTFTPTDPATPTYTLTPGSTVTVTSTTVSPTATILPTLTVVTLVSPEGSPTATMTLTQDVPVTPTARTRSCAEVYAELAANPRKYNDSQLPVWFERNCQYYNTPQPLITGYGEASTSGNGLSLPLFVLGLILSVGGFASLVLGSKKE